ncbi:PilZ domain-containing protein [Rhizorhapis sp.]|uniref:PilZ domain-containing protein n=1 Tax=Rhizorhapis sp. TaxID=1968842 RepID=UPI002B4886C4|nr:PilZ domain-containing protein [Rhizorhapis sp.]HKR16366.1 PilZ domain-containing protein [Rhizorhapis sp.]
MKNLRSLSEPASPAHARRAGRDLVDFKTSFSSYQGEGDLHVVNISRLGLMARTKAAVSKSERLIVQLPLCGKVEALVRWVEDGRIGTEFVTPVCERTYARMLALMPGRQQAW